MKSYSKNIVGAFFMSVSMAGFVVNDAIMKIIASDLNLEQSIFIRGIFCTLFILVFFSLPLFYALPSKHHQYKALEDKYPL